LDYDALAAEMQTLRNHVAGVTDTMIAAADGIPILADIAETIDPVCIAALAAADLGLARKAAEVTRQGMLRQTVVYSSGGYMAVYAVDPMALIVVLGDGGLNIGRLHQVAQRAIERVASILAYR
jgi:predicted regulator of Ras-like GTPase activity (Roadblock/LC7/MglB family)